ncbi:hypothetical protein I4U23_004789 [Adineta vaga]|nr:hypothetical protein I4U23_004789 [Adineta vaga]
MMWNHYRMNINPNYVGARDQYQYHRRLFSFPVQPLPSRVDLRRFMTDVEDQRKMNTCCANAFVGIYEYLIKRTTGYYIDVSRLFINFNGQIRTQYGRLITDLGVNQRDIALGIREYGVCKETSWPYKENFLNVMPSRNAYEEANRYTVILLRVPIDILAIEICLQNGVPVPIDIILDDDTSNNIIMNNGYLVIRQLNDQSINRRAFHTVVIVGYDRQTRHFIVRNSWGSNWGDRGYFYMPYDFIYSRLRVNYKYALWTIVEIIPRGTKLPSVLQLVVPES